MNLNDYENATLCAHEIAVLNAKYYTVGGGLIQPTGERWPVMASEAPAEAKNQKNIVPDTFLYL